MIEQIVRKNIRNLKPYTSARDIYREGILLDANENSFGSVIDSDEELNRYPDPSQLSMRMQLGEYLGISHKNLFFGVGSDEIIDLLIRIFCEPGTDAIMIPEPTYGMYRVAADINNVRYETVFLNDEFDLDSGSVLNKWNNSIKIIFLCSPNNPTGNLINKDHVKKLVQSTGSVVVVDEAYIDFAGEESSCRDLVNRFPNLVILRTFSKAWGLAGIRLGYCIAGEKVTEYLFKVKAPYNINSLTRSAFNKALLNISKKNQFIEAILSEKKYLIDELEKLSAVQRIYHSDTNYILIKVKNASIIQRTLAEKGIIIRDRSSQPKLENCLRITVGTHDQNQKLLELFHILLPDESSK